MKIKQSTVVALIFGAINFSAHAATVTQTFNFPFTFSDVITNANDQRVFFPNSGNYEASVISFNTTLGTLESVDLNWTWGVSFSGVTGPIATGGNVTLNMGGSLLVSGSGYGSGNTSGNGSAGPNTPFTAVAPQTSVLQNYSAAGAGVTYNPTIWANFTGNSPYIAKLRMGTASQNYSGLASGTFTSNADLVVTYNYTAAVPEPSSLGLLALGAAGLVARRKR
jgi:hypothetical protein